MPNKTVKFKIWKKTRAQLVNRFNRSKDKVGKEPRDRESEERIFVLKKRSQISNFISQRSSSEHKHTLLQTLNSFTFPKSNTIPNIHGFPEPEPATAKPLHRKPLLYHSHAFVFSRFCLTCFQFDYSRIRYA